jgi:hypothetical protein
MTILLDELDDVCAITVSAIGTFCLDEWDRKRSQKWSLNIMEHTGPIGAEEYCIQCKRSIVN